MYPIIDFSGPGVSKQKFVKFWNKHYSWNRPGYDENIGKELTEKRALELFNWKYRFSSNKIPFIKSIIEAPTPLPNNASDIDGLTRYFSKFPTSTVYPVFWLHCNSPEVFPIVDQHAYRSMRFIKSGKIFDKFFNYEKAQRNYQQSYIHDYIPFINEFDGIHKRKVDKALMAFGQFLKKYLLVKKQP
jgi:hypothetical protein